MALLLQKGRATRGIGGTPGHDNVASAGSRASTILSEIGQPDWHVACVPETMNYAELLLEMTVRLAGVTFLKQEDDPRLPVDLRPAQAERAMILIPPNDLRFTYSSVNPRHLDRLDLASWQHAGGDLLHAVVGYDTRDPLWLKSFRVAAAGVAHYAIDFSAHEFGHISSFSRAGCRDVVFGSEDQVAEEWESPTLVDFLTGAFESSPAPVNVGVSDWKKIGALFTGRPRAYAEFMILTEAGGLNQEQIGLAGQGERLSEEGLSVLEVAPFLLAATSTLRYSGSAEHSDLADYVERLEELGVRGDVATIKLLSAVRLLSGSGLSLMGAFLSDLAGGGHAEARPIRFSLGEDSHVDAPEFESYLSRYGPTVKASAAFRIGGVDLQPSYERSFAGGESTHEAGLRARAELAPWLRLTGAAFAGDEGGRWMEGGFEARPLGWLTLNASYVSATGYTVHREVFGANLPMIDASESGLRLTIGVTWTF
jgi:hypothetical protein